MRQARFTLPWRGRVDRQSDSEGGRGGVKPFALIIACFGHFVCSLRSQITPPRSHLRCSRPSPSRGLQGRVKPRCRAFVHSSDFCVRISDPSQANAPPPLLFGRRGVRPRRIPDPPALEIMPRARGTPVGPGALKFTQRAQTKVLGPAGLDASRRRGLSMVRFPPAPLENADEQTQVRQSHGVPRAVFDRFAPHGPRWTYLSGNLPYGSLPIHRSGPRPMPADL